MMRYLIEVMVPYLHNNILLYFIIISKHNNDKKNDALVQHISTCVGHLQVTVKCNEVYDCLLYLHIIC
jgi:hypothetical protein